MDVLIMTARWLLNRWMLVYCWYCKMNFISWHGITGVNGHLIEVYLLLKSNMSRMLWVCAQLSVSSGRHVAAAWSPWLHKVAVTGLLHQVVTDQKTEVLWGLWYLCYFCVKNIIILFFVCGYWRIKGLIKNLDCFTVWT